MRRKGFVGGVFALVMLSVQVASVSAAQPAQAAGPVKAARAGGLDPRFGDHGTVSVGSGDPRTAYGVAVQPDGRIITAGYANRNGDNDIMLTRFTSTGSLDRRFGTGGTVLTDVSGSGSYDIGRALALQPDGKIVIAGQSSTGPGMALARYDRNGHPDPGFGTAGLVATRIPGIAYAVTVQPDGRIVVTGSADTGTGTGNDVAVARFRPDGTPDTTFSTDGLALTDISAGAGARAGDDTGRGIALQPDGALVVAGSSNPGDGNRFALLRYRPDGTPDTSFGTDGVTLTDVGGTGHTSAAAALVVRPDATIVAAGSSQAPGGTSSFALAGYRPDGHLDTSFGTGGTTLTQVGGAGDHAGAADLALSPTGRLVAAGSTGQPRHGDFALTRYTADGAPDPTFGDHGSIVTDFGGTDDRAFGVALQRDGKVVAAGYAGFTIAVARYLP